MKLYEVKTAAVTVEDGRPAGWRHAAWTISEERANEIAQDLKKDIMNRTMWWLDTAKELDGTPRVVVEYWGVITE